MRRTPTATFTSTSRSRTFWPWATPLTDKGGRSSITGPAAGSAGLSADLQRIQTVANHDTKIVPAQGPLLTFADITTQVDMYGTIYDRLVRMLNKGHSPSEGVAAKPAKEYEAKMGDSDAFIRRAFESLWAYLSPDA